MDLLRHEDSCGELSHRPQLIWSIKTCFSEFYRCLLFSLPDGDKFSIEVRKHNIIKSFFFILLHVWFFYHINMIHILIYFTTMFLYSKVCKKRWKIPCTIVRISVVNLVQLFKYTTGIFSHAKQRLELHNFLIIYFSSQPYKTNGAHKKWRFISYHIA